MNNYVWYDDRESERQRTQAIAQTQAKIAELEKGHWRGEEHQRPQDRGREEARRARCASQGAQWSVRMMDALASATPKKVWVENLRRRPSNAVSIDGSAVSHDEVAEFMRALNGVVWTPKGRRRGRLVDHRRESEDVPCGRC